MSRRGREILYKNKYHIGLAVFSAVSSAGLLWLVIKLFMSMDGDGLNTNDLVVSIKNVEGKFMLSFLLGGEFAMLVQLRRWIKAYRMSTDGKRYALLAIVLCLMFGFMFVGTVYAIIAFKYNTTEVIEYGQG